MKKDFLKDNFISLGLLLLSSTIAWANSINLYEQPKAESKVIGNLDSKAGMVSIFTSSDGNWIKVGDPRNGNTGWIKSSDLEKKNLNYNLIKTSDGLNHYQIVQYGNVKPLNTAQISHAIRQMELHQQAIHRNMQRMMHDMFADAEWMHSRMFVPVFMVPVKAETQKQQNPKSSQVSANKSV